MLAIIGFVSMGWLGCATAPPEDGISGDPKELAEEIIRAGAVRRDVDQVIIGFERIVEEQVGVGLRELRVHVEALPAAEQRARGEAHLAAMPGRLDEALDDFVGSIDFDSLSVELYGPEFEKRFNTRELQDILRFYRSSAGAALVRERTDVATAGTQQLASRMEPTMEAFMRQWFDAELAALKQAVGVVDSGNAGSPGEAESKP